MIEMAGASLAVLVVVGSRVVSTSTSGRGSCTSAAGAASDSASFLLRLLGMASFDWDLLDTWCVWEWECVWVCLCAESCNAGAAPESAAEGLTVSCGLMVCERGGGGG